MTKQTSPKIETIAAQATPPGRGGVGIVRVSGPLVKDVMQRMTQRVLKPREAKVLYMRVFFESKLVCYMGWQLSDYAML